MGERLKIAMFGAAVIISTKNMRWNLLETGVKPGL